MDLQKLINEVHIRPAIWDQKNIHYHNRDVILKMWREIARACNVSNDLAKSKWKHLRDNFRNELKKTYRGKQSNDGGSPSTIEHESKWVWFKSLQFLRDQMNSRVIGCVAQNSQFTNALEETQIEPQIDILEGDEEAHFDDFDGDSSQSMLLAEEQGMPPPPKRRINRKRNLIDPIDAEYPDRRHLRLLAGCHDDDGYHDDTYHFLMSVRSPMRSLPLERQMYVRLKIQELILNEITGMQHQADSKHSVNSVQNCSPELSNDFNDFT